MINITINGKSYEGQKGETILDVAKRNDITIPVLCDRAQVNPFGSCRLCLVEQQKARFPVVACSTPISDGMVVNTDSEEIRKLRTLALELLFSNHFADCVAPCNLTCPAGIDIQGYVGLAANGQYAAAEKLLKQSIPFPGILGRVCPAPCQKECRRNLVDETISIKHIKRFISDHNFAKGERYFPTKEKPTGKSVAIVGGGPAGLSCAYYLALKGHQCTIIEKMPKAGGMVRYGIPDYRMPQNMLDAEIAEVEALGVEFNYNTLFGKDMTLDELRRDYDAVFIAIGAHESKLMEIPGEELEGVYQGIYFLRDVKLGKKFDLGDTVVVVGGGNTAIDAARTALRLGAKNCIIVYRRSRLEMPADPIEVHDAEEEGIKFHFLTNPVRISGNKRMDAIECIRMELGEPDASGRRRPVEVKGSEFSINADTIIMAIGQEPDTTCIGPECEIQITKWSTFRINETTFQTHISNVFAGGDAVRGPSTVIECVGDGRRAAVQMDKFLRNQEITKIPEIYSVQRGASLQALRPFEAQWKERFPAELRAIMPMLEPLDRNKSFVECEKGLSEESSRKEAKRCLECGCLSQFDCELREIGATIGANPAALKTDGEIHYEPDGRHPFIMKDQNKCILCGSCVRACDELRHVGAWGFVERGYITTVQPSFGKPLQKTECEACGTCVQVCPTGSLDEKFLDAKPVPENYTNMPGGCAFCGFGCRLDLGHVDGRLVAVTGAQWGHNKGLLCKYGRYGTRYINNLKRIEEPMKCVNGQFVPIAWDEAMSILEEKVKNIPGKDWMVFAGGRLTLEELAQLSTFAGSKIPGAKLGSFAYDSILGGKIIAETFSTDGPPWGYSEIDGAELIFTVGLCEKDLMTVLGVKIRDAKAKGATLIGLGRQEQKKFHHVFDRYLTADSCAAFLASMFKKIATNSTIEGCNHICESLNKENLPPADLDFVTRLTERKRAVIVVSGHTGQSAIQWAANIAAVLNVPILNLPTKINAQGTIEIGFTDSPSEKRALFITAEDPIGCAVDHAWVSGITSKAEFIAVADAFLTPTCEKADLLLPIKVSGERKGTFFSGEGRIIRLTQALKVNFISFFDKLPEAIPPQRVKGVPGEERLKTTIKERIIRAADISDSSVRISNGGDFLDLTVSKEFERLEI